MFASEWNKQHFKCSFCPKSYNKKCNLRRHEADKHMKVFTSKVEKKYHCLLCPKRFSRAECVNKHREKVHGVPKIYSERWVKRRQAEKKYCCMFCDLAYATKDGRSRHTSKYHADKVNFIKAFGMETDNVLLEENAISIPYAIYNSINSQSEEEKLEEFVMDLKTYMESLAGRQSIQPLLFVSSADYTNLSTVVEEKVESEMEADKENLELFRIYY